MKPNIETETELNLYFETMHLFIATNAKAIKESLKSIAYFRDKYRAELKR